MKRTPRNQFVSTVFTAVAVLYIDVSADFSRKTCYCKQDVLLTGKNKKRVSVFSGIVFKQVASLTDKMLEISFVRKMYNYRSLSLHFSA